MASVFSVRQGGRLASNERGRPEQEPRGQWRTDTALLSGGEQSVATSLEQSPQQLHLIDSVVLPSSLWQPRGRGQAGRVEPTQGWMWQGCRGRREKGASGWVLGTGADPRGVRGESAARNGEEG